MDEIEILRRYSQGYCCSQILVLLVLELGERTNPDLVNFARGLCMGGGKADGPCGILTAGTCILSMMSEEQDLRAGMQEDWETFFEASVPQTGMTQCRRITPSYPLADQAVCGSLLLRSFDRLMAILGENDLDPQDLGNA